MIPGFIGPTWPRSRRNDLRYVAATGALGSGIDARSLHAAMSLAPAFVAADAGTTDAGPYYLGAGRCAFSAAAVEADLRTMLSEAVPAGVPVLIGSAGTAGGDVHVDWVLDRLRAAVSSQPAPLAWPPQPAPLGRPLKVAIIRTEPSREALLERLDAGAIVDLSVPGAPPLEFGHDAIRAAARIVVMIGVEPIQLALAAHPDVLIAGRCSDAALYAAIPAGAGFDEGAAWHAGKVAECGTLACVRSGRGVLVVRIDRTGFEVSAVSALETDLRVTPQSVAAHSLYENADPNLHRESTGTLDITNATYAAVDERTVSVKGSAFVPGPRTLKIEAASLSGHETVIVGGVRDPMVLGVLDDWLDDVEKATRASIAEVLPPPPRPGSDRIHLHVYGRDAIMGPTEPTATVSHEVGIVASFFAATQERATAMAELARQPLLHTPVAGWSGAITVLACLHSPAHIERGPVYEFVANHAVHVASPLDLISIEHVEVG